VDIKTSRTAATIGLLSFLAFSSPALAQQRLELQFGVRLGIPLTDSFTTDIPGVFVGETVERVPASVGPTFEAILYNRSLVQLDAMYKPFHGSENFNPPTAPTFNLRAASFEFPIVADYLFTKGKLRPYAGIGAVAAHIINGTIETGLSTSPFEGQLFLRPQLPAYVANGGLEWNTSRFVVRPEIRYTKWSTAHDFQMVRNQVEVSVGVSLHGKHF
jgi:hypothetical protein